MLPSNEIRGDPPCWKREIQLAAAAWWWIEQAATFSSFQIQIKKDPKQLANPTFSTYVGGWSATSCCFRPSSNVCGPTTRRRRRRHKAGRPAGLPTYLEAVLTTTAAYGGLARSPVGRATGRRPPTNGGVHVKNIGRGGQTRPPSPSTAGPGSLSLVGLFLCLRTSPCAGCGPTGNNRDRAV